MVEWAQTGLAGIEVLDALGAAFEMIDTASASWTAISNSLAITLANTSGFPETTAKEFPQRERQRHVFPGELLEHFLLLVRHKLLVPLAWTVLLGVVHVRKRGAPIQVVEHF